MSGWYCARYASPSGPGPTGSRRILFNAQSGIGHRCAHPGVRGKRRPGASLARRTPERCSAARPYGRGSERRHDDRQAVARLGAQGYCARLNHGFSMRDRRRSADENRHIDPPDEP